jgi:uncharacterized membrane protein
MVRELEIIFGVHTVAGHLGIARHVAEFLQQLRSIAARPVIDPVARITIPAITAALLAGIIVVPATTAAGLTIVDQRFVPMLTTKTLLSLLARPWPMRVTGGRGIHTLGPRASANGFIFECRQKCGSRPPVQTLPAHGQQPWLAR